jgi:superfamily I DNA/RNA helicase/RecB family exonuclease
VEASEIRVDPEDWPRVLGDTDGYQMVVAGPGTGKTEFLVRRAAHLIDSGAARREEIVVLCFSRRASADLRGRIEEAVGATGLPVDVTTFHSLALRMMETAAAGERPIPLTTPEQVGVVAALLRESDPADWPITFRGILGTTAFAAEVADFLMRCSERLLTPNDLEAFDRQDWRGIPGLFARYLTSLSESGRTDYGSLLVSLVELLRTEPGAEMAARYRYVLVDEYQDTSPAQAEITTLLAARHGNLTVTGDPYQSIYSFRGAELGNVAAFSRDHPESRRLVLASSFRVPREILDSALRVVSSGHLPGAAGPVDPAPHKGRSEVFIFDQETAEAEWIAREVEHAVRAEGIEPSAIAVLVRSKKELISELSRALARRRVPHDPPETRLVDHQSVRVFHDLVTVAKWGADRPGLSPTELAEGDRAMRRILLGPLVAIGLGQERALLRERQRTRAPWADIIDRHLPDRPGLADLVLTADWSENASAISGFWHAWTTLEGIDAIVADDERTEWRRAWASFAQVLSRQAERDPGLSLARFFELTEEEDFEATPLLSHRSTDMRVTLTTLHQAKGLEFDLVFIANAVEGVFPDLRRSRRMLRPELLSPERTTDPQAQHVFQLQEEMRLAYTAMTRARLRVVWTATDAGVDQGERRPSRFLMAASGKTSLDEIGAPIETEHEPITLREAETSLRRALADPAAAAAFRLAAADILTTPDDLWWDAAAFPGVPRQGPDAPILADTIRLSPSQADSYQRCPRQYALERRLRLGDASSPYAHFGTLVHAALEQAEADVVGTDERHTGLDHALECLDRVWEDADFGTEELNQAWLGKAREAVAKLYENWPSSAGAPIGLEMKVEMTVGEITWRGVVDRVEQTEEGLRIVDYKTSATAMAVADAAESIQLGFYSDAVEAATGRPVVGAELWYPRARAKSLTTRSLDHDRREDIRSEMERVTAAIRSEDWTPTAGNHCERCSFRLSCPAWPEGRGAFLP